MHQSARCRQSEVHPPHFITGGIDASRMSMAREARWATPLRSAACHRRTAGRLFQRCHSRSATAQSRGLFLSRLEPSGDHMVDYIKAFRTSGGPLTPRRHSRRHGAVQNTGECAQQFHFCRRGSLIVPGADDTSRQQA